MFILRIIPITKGLPEDFLTYFAKEKISIGSLVEIKIRSRLLFGIVFSCKNLLEEKMNIKSSDFKIKKIEKVVQENFLKINLLQALDNFANLQIENTHNIQPDISKNIHSNFKSKINQHVNVSTLLSLFILKDSLPILTANLQKSNPVSNILLPESRRRRDSGDNLDSITENRKNLSEEKNDQTISKKLVFEQLEVLTTKKEKIILEKYSTRIEIYKKIINQSLAKKESLVIYFPTIQELENAKVEINKKGDPHGLQEMAEIYKKQIIVIHSKLSKKNLRENLQKIEKKSPLIIFSTPSLIPFLLAEKINLQTIILEKENSDYYLTQEIRKKIDTRELIKNLGKEMRVNLIYGAEIPTLSTYLKLKEKKIKIYNSKNTKTLTQEKNVVKKTPSEKKANALQIIDMTKPTFAASYGRPRKASAGKAEYNEIYFANLVIEKLEEVKKQKTGHVFIYTQRKGLATETVCADCQTILKCQKCEKPLILFKKNKSPTQISFATADQSKKNRLYKCLSCQTEINLPERELTCTNCQSWNLKTLGIGTEGLVENLQETGWKTFLLDKENINSKKKAENIIQNWQKEKLAILVGTELALNFLNSENKIDLMIVCSLDSLLAIPEINMDQKILNLILGLKDKLENSKQKNHLIIQTRCMQAPIWKYVQEENYLKFLDNELMVRKELHLPPYFKI